MKRKSVRILAMALCAVAVMSGLSGCGDGGKSPDTEKVDAVETSDEDIDPFGVFEEPITISVARRDFGDDGAPVGEDAPWTQKYKEYGINLNVIWSANASQFNDKLNTAIASGDVPDIFQVGNSEQMNTLVKADMVADLTEVFEKYASPLVKERFSTDAGKAALEAATFDGKLRYIPINITESLNDMNLLYIRKDWLDNLGLDLPETVEDLKNIALAFTNDDPDGNGENDTYGLAIPGKDGLGGFNTWFTGYGIYAGDWYDGMIFYSEDENGNARWDGESPRVREALADLQELYAAGAIVRDFATYDGSRCFEDLNGGKAGLCIGARGYPAWAIQNTYINDPNAEWFAMKMPSVDSETETILAGFQPLNAAYAVSASCSHPEGVIRMLNLVTEISNPESEMFDADYMIENRAITGDCFIQPILDPLYERKETQSIAAAVKNEDPTGLNDTDKRIYDNVLKFEEDGDPAAWTDWNRYYPAEGHAYYVIYEMNKDTEIKRNLWQKLPTVDMTSKLAVWSKMFDEAFINIVSGADVTVWDQTVEDWNKLGGDEITQAVNDSLQ